MLHIQVDESGRDVYDTSNMSNTSSSLREKNLHIHCTLDSIHLAACSSGHASKINRVPHRTLDISLISYARKEKVLK